jgi:hypothetical protein
VNFVNGKIISDSECDSVLERIDEMLINTIRKPPLDVNLVINACDALIKNIDGLNFINRFSELGVSPVLAEMYIDQIGQMLNADSIRERLRIELGDNYGKSRILTYSHSKATAVQTIAPLGVLFHITAGNVDGLPFISLLDGLLTGNINIVKLPKEEGGVTVSLLEELFKIEPSLREYVYVFDYSSKDINAMRKLAAAADAVVVWGGDKAVSAIRKLADPNTRIIEWGHKISFAYVTKEGKSKNRLEKLATHICLTNQLFCSSCQGVFLDTDDMRDVYDFCEDFLPIFEEACLTNPFVFDAAANIFIQAEVTLQDYNRKIENKNAEARIFRGQNCSITAQPDGKLEPSIMYRNIWVKPLRNENIISLRPYKNYLQTAALICTEQEHAEISQKLLKTGLVKISDGYEMSNYAFGEAHDGVFTLRCYTKLVSVQEFAMI